MWISKAAEQGLDKAQYNLGKMYRDGIGVDKDVVAAARAFLAAAEQGYAKAQNHIGVRLVRGEGIAKDEVQALMWLTLAARQGHASARENRKALARKLGTAVRDEAERRARDWKPRK